MRIHKRVLRRIIREALLEQVVGFNVGAAPAAAKYGSSQIDDSGDDDDFLSVGDTSVPVEPGSQEEVGSLKSDVQTLTQDRQKELDKNNAPAATSTGRQLSAVRKKLG